MGILNTLGNKVEEKVEGEPQTPPVEKAPKESITEEVEASTIDRSAYNCPVCGGEGLVKDNFEEGNFVRCPNCGGTGKK